MGLDMIPPFLIGIYTGPEKPESFDEYMKAFCDEIDAIEREGGVMVNGHRIPLFIRAFICDTPARSYVTNTHHHNHHNGCHKCVQPTEFINNARFYSKTVGEKRTDLSFFRRLDYTHHDEAHQTIRSRLELSNFKMVTQFPIELMHQSDLGVLKSMACSILERQSILKLSTIQIKDMDTVFQSYRKYTPSEFARRPRGFNELHNF